MELFYPTMRQYPAGFGAMAIALEETVAPPAVLVLRGEPDALGQWAGELAGELLPDTMALAIPDAAAGLPPAFPW